MLYNKSINFTNCCFVCSDLFSLFVSDSIINISVVVIVVAIVIKCKYMEKAKTLKIRVPDGL